MCLVLLALHAHPDCDVLLAGNRDEHYRRPSAPPADLGGDPRIFAGRDLEGGGTWMGYNAAGLFAALTNFRQSVRTIPPDALTRGKLVMGLLRHRDPAAAAEWLVAQEMARYRPFNVLFGTQAHFLYYSSHGEAPPRSLAAGYYVLSNSVLDDRSWPKVRRAHEFFAARRHLPGEQFLLALQAFLSDATPPDDLPSRDRDEEIHGNLGAVFIRSPEYGTVSSSVITAGGTLGARYYFAQGEEMYRTRHDMARRLARLAPRAEAGEPANPFHRLELAW